MYKAELSDPRSHSPDNFVYLAHGIINPFDQARALNPTALETRIRNLSDPDHHYRASAIGKLDAKSAESRFGWMGGDISQVGTYGVVGLLIDPATDDHVKIGWQTDLGSPVGKQELADYVSQHSGKVKPISFLLNHTVGPYNEVILAGGEGTQVTGVFYLPGTAETNPKAIQEAQSVARAVEAVTGNKVPIIEIPYETSPKHEDPAIQARLAELARLQEDMATMQARAEFHGKGGAFGSRSMLGEYINISYEREVPEAEIILGDTLKDFDFSPTFKTPQQKKGDEE